MLKNKLINFFPVIVLFLLSLIPILWYRGDSIIGGGDMGLPLDLEVHLKKGVSVWDESVNAGKNTVFGLSRIPEYYFLKVISFSTLPVNKIEIVYFCLVSAGILFSFNFFAREVLSENNSGEKSIIALIGSVFYYFNFFSITRWEGFDRPILYLMIGVPLLLGLIIKNLKKESVLNYFFIGVSSLVFSYSAVNLPSFLAGVLLILTFYIFMIIKSLWANNYSLFKKIIFLGLKNLIVVLTCNIYWIIPTLNLGSPNTVFNEVAPFDWLGGISQSCTPFNVIRLLGAWYWYQSGSAPYSEIYFQNKYFMFLIYLIPVFCLAGIIISFIKKKKETYFLIPILFLGLVLSMGDNGPFGKIYRYLYDNIVLFRVFRSPWFKFSVFTILGYSFYFGIFSLFIFRITRKYLPKIFSLLILLLLFSYPIVLAHPMITASFYKNWRIKIPDYVRDAIKFIDSGIKEGERVYIYTYDQNANYDWGYLSITPVLFRLANWSTIGPWSNYIPNDLTNKLTKSVDLGIKNNSNQQISNFLSYLRVKYLLLRKDVLFLEEQQFNSAEEQFRKMENIKLVSNFSKWDVYENSKILPLFVWKDRLVNVPDVEMFLSTVDSGETEDIYCIDCSDSQEVINRYRLNPGDFIQKENQVRSFKFETKEKINYFFSVKTVNPFKVAPIVYLDGEVMVLKSNDKGELFTMKRQLMPGEHKISLEESVFSNKNFVKNGNFSDQLSFWDYFEEGTYYDLPIKSSLEEFGTGRVKLAAVNKPVVMSQKINGLEKNKKYRLRFTFKSLGKLPLQVGISTQQLEATKFIIDPEYQKFYSKKEAVGEIIFQSDFPMVFINFYTKVLSKEPNPQVISNVSLQEAGIIDSIEIIPEINQSYKDFTYKKNSSTDYSIKFSNEKPGWITFNVTCNKGWKAFENGKELAGLCVNSFANSYYVPSIGEHKIELFYLPERIYKKMLTISFSFIVFLLVSSIGKTVVFTRKTSTK